MDIRKIKHGAKTVIEWATVELGKNDEVIHRLTSEDAPHLDFSEALHTLCAAALKSVGRFGSVFETAKLTEVAYKEKTGGDGDVTESLTIVIDASTDGDVEIAVKLRFAAIAGALETALLAVFERAEQYIGGTRSQADLFEEAAA